MTLRAWPAGLAVLSLAACQTTPEQPPLRPYRELSATTEVVYYEGSPLAPPRNRRPVSRDPGAAERISVEFRAFEEFPGSELAPIGLSTRLVTTGHEAWRGSPRLFAGGRFATVKDPAGYLGGITGSLGRVERFRPAVAALWSGVTTRIDLRSARRVLEATGENERLSISIYRAPAAEGEEGRPRLRLAIEAAVAPLGAAEKEGLSGWRETVLLEDIFGLTQSLVFLLPNPLRSGGRGVAIIVSLGPAPEEGETGFADFERVVAEAQTVLSQDPRSVELKLREVRARPSGIESRLLLDAMRQPSKRRGALVALANQTGALLCEGLSQAGSDTFLGELARAIREARSRSELAPRGAALGWGLEQVALETVREAFLDREEPPAEIRAVIGRYAGGVGSDPGALAEVFAGVDDLEDLRETLVYKNIELLRDGSAYTRLNAFLWLRARAYEPAGYDPMRPVSENEEALLPYEQGASAMIERRNQP